MTQSIKLAIICLFVEQAASKRFIIKKLRHHLNSTELKPRRSGRLVMKHDGGAERAAEPAGGRNDGPAAGRHGDDAPRFTPAVRSVICDSDPCSAAAFMKGKAVLRLYLFWEDWESQIILTRRHRVNGNKNKTRLYIIYKPSDYANDSKVTAVTRATGAKEVKGQSKSAPAPPVTDWKKRDGHCSRSAAGTRSPSLFM